MLGDVNRHCDSLTEILGRLSKIGDSLHGPEPREANVPTPASPVVSVRHELNRAEALAQRIHSELTRIEHRL